MISASKRERGIFLVKLRHGPAGHGQLLVYVFNHNDRAPLSDSACMQD